MISTQCVLHGQPSNFVGLESALEVLYIICLSRRQFTSEYCEIYSGSCSVNLSHSIDCTKEELVSSFCLCSFAVKHCSLLLSLV